MNDREMEIRERQMREKNLKAEITLRISAGKYRAFQEMARLSGKESLTFFKEPSQLQCEFCPINKCNSNSRAGGVLCVGYFFTWLFSEV